MKTTFTPAALLGLFLGGTFGLTIGTSFAATAAPSISTAATMSSQCVRNASDLHTSSAGASAMPELNGNDRFFLRGGL